MKIKNIIKTLAAACIALSRGLIHAQFVPDDEIELTRDEPLLFNSSVYRQGRKGEKFRVADYRPATRKVFIFSTDAKGKAFALNVPDAAVALVGKDPAMLSEKAFAALREGRLEDAQKLMLQVSLLDPERSICAEIAMHVGRLMESARAYEALAARQGQVDAEIKRILRNADVAGRPNALIPNDRSGDVRAEQMRREAQKIDADAKSRLAEKQGGILAELKLLEQVAIKLLTVGSFGETLDVMDMILGYASRKMQAMTRVEFPSSRAALEVKGKAAEARKHLEDARRHMASKKIHAARKSVDEGISIESGSYSLRRLRSEISTAIDSAAKTFAMAGVHRELKDYDSALKAVEKLRMECADHEAAETMAVSLRSTIAEKAGRLEKAHTAEKAGNFGEALSIYDTYAQAADIERVLPIFALQREREGDFLSSYHLYEKASLPKEMQRVRAMKDEQMADYVRARVFLVDTKFTEALAIYRRYKDVEMEGDAVKQQGAHMETQGKFDDAVELYRCAGLVREVARVKEFVSSRETLIRQGKEQEGAASYDKAIELFHKANATDDARRVAATAAKAAEAKKVYEEAAEYYEMAGMFEEAGRIRRNHEVTPSVRTLSDQELFKKCAPACVTVIGETGLGSGFFIKKGGYILTNQHVVDGASRIRIRTSTNAEYPATVLVISKVPDLALLKAEIGEHPVLKIGDSDKVETAATASTIGSPKGRAQSYTKGNISNNDRDYRGNKCFQISVLINHGNSGGPLLDEQGYVIGICTFGEGTAAILKNGMNIGSDIQGINYAIRINEARKVFGATLVF